MFQCTEAFVLIFDLCVRILKSWEFTFPLFENKSIVTLYIHEWAGLNHHLCLAFDYGISEV